MSHTVPQSGNFASLWSNLDKACAQQHEPAISAPPRPFLPHLKFDGDGNAQAYQIFGWNHPEQGYTWSAGIEAVLELSPPSQPGNYLLNARIAPLLAPSLPRQRVRVHLGTRCVAHWNVDCAGHYFALLIGSMLNDRQELTFHLPDAHSPRALGLGPDDRELALRFYEVWLTPWLPVSF